MLFPMPRRAGLGMWDYVSRRHGAPPWPSPSAAGSPRRLRGLGVVAGQLRCRYRLFGRKPGFTSCCNIFFPSKIPTFGHRNSILSTDSPAQPLRIDGGGARASPRPEFPGKTAPGCRLKIPSSGVLHGRSVAYGRAKRPCDEDRHETLCEKLH